MAGKIVDKFLEKVPFSNEIIEAVNKNFDLTFTKQLATEISHQLLEQGSKLKNEITNAVSEQIRKEIIHHIDGRQRNSYFPHRLPLIYHKNLCTS